MPSRDRGTAAVATILLLLFLAALWIWPAVAGHLLDADFAMMGNPHAPFLPVLFWGIASFILSFLVIPLLVGLLVESLSKMFSQKTPLPHRP